MHRSRSSVAAHCAPSGGRMPKCPSAGSLADGANSRRRCSSPWSSGAATPRTKLFTDIIRGQIEEIDRLNSSQSGSRNKLNLRIELPERVAGEEARESADHRAHHCDQQTGLEPEYHITEEDKMDLSFSGAGFMGCYYFGVVDCWNKYIPRRRVRRVAGASAGALIAAYYLMDLPLDSCLSEIIALTEDIRRRPLGVFDRKHQIVDLLPQILDKLFPDDAHKRVSGRLFVYMTRLKDLKEVCVSEFDSKKDLIDALNCSSFIPLWSGNHVSTYKGVKHIDGGLKNNLPIFDEHTIRICCFAGASDISPYDRAQVDLLSGSFQGMPFYVTMHNLRRLKHALVPPPPNYVISLLERGFHDTKDFILTNDLIQCDKCFERTRIQDQPIYAKKSPLLSPKIDPDEEENSSKRRFFANSKSHSKSTSSIAELSDKSANSSQDLAAAAEADEKKKTRTFASKLRNKLQKVASANCVRDSGASEQAKDQTDSWGKFNGLPVPNIVIDNVTSYNDDQQTIATEIPTINIVLGDDDDDDDDNADQTADFDSQQSNGDKDEDFNGTGQNGRAVKLTENPRLSETQIIMENNNSLLPDKFAPVGDPLPSCPPSPNLNRHCSECIRMRQQARLDLVDEEIRNQAAKYRTDKEVEEAYGFRSKLASKLRWFKQLGVKNSYSFVDESDQQAPAVPKTIAV